jgi:probable rRNA maturation factor
VARRAAAGGPSVAVDILTEAGDWPNRSRLQRLAERAVGAAVAVARPALASAPEVSVVFTDDAHIRELNRRHRGKGSATNVLSFPAGRHDGARLGPLLGDIVLSSGAISQEAADQGLLFDHHLTHLIVHGFLHLLGYDHTADKDAAVMEGLETAILASLGIADPYAFDHAGRDG